MDTLVLQRPRIEKIATSAAGITIAICLLLNLPASGISVGNYTGLSPTLNYIKENPKEVVINEAVELAKKFSTEKSPKFINGVLADIFK